MTTETNQSELEKLLADSKQALKDYCEYKGVQYPQHTDRDKLDSEGNYTQGERHNDPRIQQYPAH